MNNKLTIYNSKTKAKEVFEPINPGHVGMYVCGPTVYNEVHLGNVRTFVSFDVIYRYLKFLGFKVRYVRNITDVGHLTDDTDEDKILKRARLEQLEPMELVQKYSNMFHEMMNIFNNLSPNVEPRATGHLIEQIEMVQEIVDNGFAYERNGSVYFDTLKYNDKYKNYGNLSGRKIDELFSDTRDDLKNQDEKNHPSDFAIWMKANNEHIMKWNSPWSVGFPGWHLECSVMSTKYLGETFDIHGGGNDLKFPHHENEIAQNVGARGVEPVRYWLHSNMLLMNGKKMSKSDGNTISPYELFTGESQHVSKGYSPMAIRFFMLQSHYRSTLDLTDMAMQGAEKGFKKLMEAAADLRKMEHSDNSDPGIHDKPINDILDSMIDDMNDDFNTPKAIADAFEIVNYINKIKDKHISLNEVYADTFEKMKSTFLTFIYDIFGFRDENTGEDNNQFNGLIEILISIRMEARNKKDWATSDIIRDKLLEIGIQLKDSKEGTSWTKI
ncbi:MAG: cysteine--tRNA ligase [Deltaproteobacteria bacterium]